MDTAEEILVALSYAEKHVEGHIVYTDKTLVKQNAEVANVFMTGLGEPIVSTDIKTTSDFFGGVSLMQSASF